MTRLQRGGSPKTTPGETDREVLPIDIDSAAYAHCCLVNYAVVNAAASTRLTVTEAIIGLNSAALSPDSAALSASSETVGCAAPPG